MNGMAPQGRSLLHLGTQSRFLLIAICIVFLITFLLAVYPLSDCNCDDVLYGDKVKKLVGKVREEIRDKYERAGLADLLEEDYLNRGDHPSWGPHKLCVLVPFRDRMEEMLEFVPHMHRFLNTQKIRHKILIINQVDVLRFNRASLINAGFKIGQAECDYIAMHDVDLLPLNMALNYSYPANGPFHIAAPHLHPKYHYPTFVGGILLLKNEHFIKANGLSNRFWGWGREDDEFYVRMRHAKLTITRPGNLTTGLNTFKHVHDRKARPRDFKKYGEQKQNARTRDRITGLDTVTFRIASENNININKAPCTVVALELQCDIHDTPWCVTPEQLQSMIEDVQQDQKEAQNQINNAAGRIVAAEGNVEAAQLRLSDAQKRLDPVHRPHKDPEQQAVDDRNAQKPADYRLAQLSQNDMGNIDPNNVRASRYPNR